ncbi:MAG TPA: ABC transporter ATP-binding protein [Micromonosporaceae bacterium]|nr:ABC transporter ATP-binding protein [Micromonosporaceae bacterium]
MTQGEPPHRPAVACQDVTRTYRTAGSRVTALDGVTLTLPRGQVSVLVGPSGSGKSTLLRLLACLDRPDGGRIQLDGVDVATLSRAARVRLRRTRIGFIFQSPADNLLGYLTVREHLELGARLRGLPATDRQVDALLDALGLTGRVHHRPAQLSGGEQQRVAIAFNALGPPAVLVADEPTGQLDHTTVDSVLDAFAVLAGLGVAVVAATHDPAVTRRADRVIQIQDGRVAEVARWS